MDEAETERSIKSRGVRGANLPLRQRVSDFGMIVMAHATMMIVSQHAFQIAPTATPPPAQRI
jgi:hypothetical protein